MLSEEEALRIAERAVEIYAARHPIPAVLEMEEAAKILGVSRRTIERMKPPRVAAGKVPYSWVLERLASR